MFKALLKTRFSLLSQSFFKNGSKRKRSPAFKILTAALLIYAVGVIAVLFTGLFSSLLPLAYSGLSWLYFAIAAIIAFSLSFIGSVFTTQQQIYASKDNDLLLSMPIPPSYIIGSRIVMLLILNAVFEALVVIPAGVVWCVFVPANVGAAGITAFVICCLAMPFLSLALSAALGFVITIITNRVKNKSLITVLISVVFFALYFYVIGNMNGYMEAILKNSAQIGETVRSSLLLAPARAFGEAAANGNLLSMVIFLACCSAPFFIVWTLLSKSFISLATGVRGVKKTKYRRKSLKASKSSAALLKKELRRFFSSALYVLNAAIGNIFIIIGAVMLIIYREYPAQLAAQLPFLKPFFAPAAAGILCWFSSTCLISASSVSLEGKNLWISRSLPIPSSDILFAKVKCHIVVTLPPVTLGAAVLIFTLGLNALDSLAVIISPAAFTVFFAFLGIIVNLHFPKTDYINETAVIKQSASVTISMLSSGGAVVAAAVLGMLLSPFVAPNVFMLAFSACIGAVCFFMYKYLLRGGAKRFEQI